MLSIQIVMLSEIVKLHIFALPDNKPKVASAEIESPMSGTCSRKMYDR